MQLKSFFFKFTLLVVLIAGAFGVIRVLYDIGEWQSNKQAIVHKEAYAVYLAVLKYQHVTGDLPQEADWQRVVYPYLPDDLTSKRLIYKNEKLYDSQGNGFSLNVQKDGVILRSDAYFSEDDETLKRHLEFEISALNCDTKVQL